MGVGSTAKGNSILIVNEQTTYETWEFLYDPRIEKLNAERGFECGVGSVHARLAGAEQLPAARRAHAARIWAATGAPARLAYLVATGAREPLDWDVVASRPSRKAGRPSVTGSRRAAACEDVCWLHSICGDLPMHRSRVLFVILPWAWWPANPPRGRKPLPRRHLPLLPRRRPPKLPRLLLPRRSRSG